MHLFLPFLVRLASCQSTTTTQAATEATSATSDTKSNGPSKVDKEIVRAFILIIAGIVFFICIIVGYLYKQRRNRQGGLNKGNMPHLREELELGAYDMNTINNPNNTGRDSLINSNDNNNNNNDDDSHGSQALYYQLTKILGKQMNLKTGMATRRSMSRSNNNNNNNINGNDNPNATAITWAMAIIGIDGSNSDNDATIKYVEKKIFKFCQQDSERLIAFKDDKGYRNQFAILIDCNGDAQFAQRNIGEIIDDISGGSGSNDNNDSNENNSKKKCSISAGLCFVCKIDFNETYKECHGRGLHSLKIAQSKMGGNCLYWDKYDKLFVKWYNNEIKNRENSDCLLPLSGMTEYKIKLNELANSENREWILATMDGDNIGMIKQQQSSISAQLAIRILSFEICKLCQKYENDEKYGIMGYQKGSDEFLLFIYCEDKEIGTKIVDKLMKRVENNKVVPFTVSVGLTYLKQNESGTDWENRAQIGLKYAKQNGKNQINWQ